MLGGEAVQHLRRRRRRPARAARRGGPGPSLAMATTPLAVGQPLAVGDLEARGADLAATRDVTWPVSWSTPIVNITDAAALVVPSSSSVLPSGAQRGQPTSAPRPSIVIRRSGCAAVGRAAATRRRTSRDASGTRSTGRWATTPCPDPRSRSPRSPAAAGRRAAPALTSMTPTSWAMSGYFASSICRRHVP